METTDVAVVGGGIGGAALAYALASAGLGVTVLEATETYPDRVRGESMQAWGLLEARRLGVEPVLMRAGAHIAPVWKQYMEGVGETAEFPMGLMVPDVPGTLNLHHPVACQALVDAARAAGATVRRGVQDVKLAGGRPVRISYTDGRARELSASLVVGADGRASTVRRQSGIELERVDPVSHVAGLLVRELEGVPDDFDAMVGDHESFFLLFHQGHGQARAYICSGNSGQRRFAGPEGARRFLEAFAGCSYPWSAAVAAATVAGPCATYPGDDTWTATPFAEHVVLIGDAAGHNDPILGQGLSIALRDARTVRDVIVGGSGGQPDFTEYAAERLGRMERLRLAADILSAVFAEDADNRPARQAWYGEHIAAGDPVLIPLLMGAFTGPETVPDEAVVPSIVDDIRRAS